MYFSLWVGDAGLRHNLAMTLHLFTSWLAYSYVAAWKVSSLFGSVLFLILADPGFVVFSDFKRPRGSMKYSSWPSLCGDDLDGSFSRVVFEQHSSAVIANPYTGRTSRFSCAFGGFDCTLLTFLKKALKVCVNSEEAFFCLAPVLEGYFLIHHLYRLDGNASTVV